MVFNSEIAAVLLYQIPDSLKLYEAQSRVALRANSFYGSSPSSEEFAGGIALPEL